jgi:two-component system response regulator AtoC
MRRASSGMQKSQAEMRGPRVLVVDDAEGIRSYLANLLQLRGYEVDTAEDGRSALALLESGASPDLVILDVMMPGMGGLGTLRKIRETDKELPVIMLSVVGRASTIVEAMQLGASDYLNKPFEEEELDLMLARLFERRSLGAERESLRKQVGDSHEPFWGSEPMQRIREVIDQISDTDVTVLIQGESGTGKEVVARSVHSVSIRAKGPFVKVNCAALPDDLLESELFGYEKGAFTGAHGRKAGKFELAHQGTIFLDEIGEMSAGLQGKLLHVLQDGTYARLGGNEEITVDARVVCATNRPVLEMVAQKTFREDLYFRLNVVSIEIPPLRERRDEVVELTRRFMLRYSAAYGKPLRSPSEKLLRLFASHPFPGNVRELENLVKRIVVLESEDSILSDLATRAEGDGRGRDALQLLLEEIEETAGDVPLREVGRRVSRQAEHDMIERVLEQTSWNRKQAAKLLNVSYKTLLQKIRDCRLEPGV